MNSIEPSAPVKGGILEQLQGGPKSAMPELHRREFTRAMRDTLERPGNRQFVFDNGPSAMIEEIVAAAAIASVPADRRAFLDDHIATILGNRRECEQIIAGLLGLA